MSRLVHIHVGGRWVSAEGNCRCTRCGKLVTSTWRYFPEPTLWTLAYCESCVELALNAPLL